MDDVSTAALLARVTGSLLVVVMLALLVARFARRTTSRGRRAGELVVRDRVALTRDTAAVVVEAGGHRLLVGVSPHQVTLLADLTPGARTSSAPRELGTARPTDAVEDVEDVVPAPRRSPEPPSTGRVDPTTGVRVHQVPMSRKVVRELDRTRRKAMPPTRRGTGSVLDPRTWQQGLEALRDLTARRG